MAKLTPQEIPSLDTLAGSYIGTELTKEVETLYLSILFGKISSDLENKLDTMLLPYSLTSGRFTMLNYLRLNSEGMKPSELSNQLGVTQATMSGLISNLEKAQYVYKVASATDARSYSIRLTETGTKIVDEVIPNMIPFIGDYFSPLDDTDKMQLVNILQKITAKNQQS